MRIVLTVCVAFFVFIPATVRGEVDLDGIPLNQFPFIFSHDAATGYIEGDDSWYLDASAPIKKETNAFAWLKNQEGTITEQIECGARAFDMRLWITDDGTLLMQHAGLVIKTEFKSMMEEMKVWASSNPDELIIAEIIRCDGTDDSKQVTCLAKAVEVLAALSITYYSNDDCQASILDGMTYGGAKGAGALTEGGSVLAMDRSCLIDNYDPTINCRGTEDEQKYSCWTHAGKTPEIPQQHMKDYLDTVFLGGAPNDGKLWQMQALWQSDQESVIDGIGAGSSLSMDEEKSCIKSFLLTSLLEGEWGPQTASSGVNLFELDNVCNRGALIAQLLNPNFSGTLEGYDPEPGCTCADFWLGGNCTNPMPNSTPNPTVSEDKTSAASIAGPITASVFALVAALFV